MHQYSAVLTKNANRDVQRLSKQVAIRIRRKIDFFVKTGKPLEFAESLTKPADAQYRWRVGDYRILFDEKDKFITILRIQHRREVYRR